VNGNIYEWHDRTLWKGDMAILYFMQFGEKMYWLISSYDRNNFLWNDYFYWKHGKILEKNQPMNSIKTADMLKEIERSDSVFS